MKQAIIFGIQDVFDQNMLLWRLLWNLILEQGPQEFKDYANYIAWLETTLQVPFFISICDERMSGMVDYVFENLKHLILEDDCFTR